MALPQIPKRIVVELSRPTVLNLAALVSYCLAMIFHLIAFATDNWCTLQLDGVEWRMGLWYGCRYDTTTGDTWNCTKDVFNDKVFKAGNNWHLGSQIMMIFALIALFLLEFAVIGYICIKRLERYRNKIFGIVVALSVAAAFCHLLVIIMYGTNVDKVNDSNVKASFGIIIISMFLEVAIPVLIRIDKHFRFPKEGALKEIRRQVKKLGIHKLSEPDRSTKREERARRPESKDADSEKKYVPRQLSASELEKRFPPYEIDNLRYYPPVSMRTSVSSITGDKTISTGSAQSLQTQTTAVTGLSYDTKYSDRSSVESLV